VFPSPLDDNKPERYHSDSAISRFVRQVENTNQRSLLSGTDTNQRSNLPQLRVDEERGVHGGEYSVSPDKQESLFFFRKLFTHKIPHYDRRSVSVFQNHLTPPDNPIRKSKVNKMQSILKSLLTINNFFYQQDHAIQYTLEETSLIARTSCLKVEIKIRIESVSMPSALMRKKIRFSHTKRILVII
jgi:hypothetical protein